MRTVTDWLGEYGSSHANPTNKLLHWLCVPPYCYCRYLGCSGRRRYPRCLRKRLALVELGDARRGRRGSFTTSHFLPALALPECCSASLLLLAITQWLTGPAVAAVAHLAGDFRGRLDRAVHRPPHRREAAVVLQGRAVPVDRAVVAGGCGLRRSGARLPTPEGAIAACSCTPRPPAASRTAAATRSCTLLSSGSGTSSSGRGQLSNRIRRRHQHLVGEARHARRQVRL